MPRIEWFGVVWLQTSSHMRFILFIPGLFVLWFSSQPVAAQSSEMLTLKYETGVGTESCPSLELLREGVEIRLGRNVFQTQYGKTKHFEVKVSHIKDVFYAELHVFSSAKQPLGERVLESKASDCTELAASLELAIVIAIDPLYGINSEEKKMVQVEPTPSAVKPPLAPIPVSDFSPVGYVSLGMIYSSAKRFGGTLGYGQHLSTSRGDFSLEVELRTDIPHIIDFGDGRISVAETSGALLGCIAHVCVVGKLGFLRSVGAGYEETQTSITPIVAAGFRGLYPVSLGQGLRLDFVGQFLVQGNHTNLFVDDIKVWESSAVEISLGVRGVVSF